MLRGFFGRSGTDMLLTAIHANRWRFVNSFPVMPWGKLHSPSAYTQGLMRCSSFLTAFAYVVILAGRPSDPH